MILVHSTGLSLRPVVLFRLDLWLKNWGEPEFFWFLILVLKKQGIRISFTPLYKNLEHKLFFLTRLKRILKKFMSPKAKISPNFTILILLLLLAVAVPWIAPRVLIFC